MISNLLKTFILKKVLVIIILYKIERKHTDQLENQSHSFLIMHLAFQKEKKKKNCLPRHHHQGFLH